ncbi:bromodomain-containing protein 8-like [Mizuhopecten yessoensis]|uniref:bromodomain-containing protein 8-like n=1 Tax=Mizuhopecten yessoensis TaxID=6573 RepID=UPI000B45B3FA|nr:bromodomain-containing protein 8-like [Mizuhopecten yessoensis]
MATPKFRHQGPLEVWSLRERLALACSVLRSGDQNWVSVSRAIRPYGEPNHTPESFSQKNCALQYAELLEKAETPKRKRGERGEIETPGVQIIRKLSIERMEELKKKVTEQQQRYKKLKKEMESIRSGQMDDKLADIWQQMQMEKKAAEEAKQLERKLAEEAEANKPRKGTVSRLFAEQGNTLIDVENIKQEPGTEPTPLLATEGPSGSSVTTALTLKTDLTTPVEDKPKSSATSELLSSLLQSKHYTVNQLEAELKQELHAQQLAAKAASKTAAPQAPPIKEDDDPASSTEDSSSSYVTPTMTKLLEKPGQGQLDEDTPQADLTGGATDSASITTDDHTLDIMVSEEVVTEEEEDEKNEVTTEDDDDTRDSTIDVMSKDDEMSIHKVDDIPEDSTESADVNSASFINVDDEISIKEEEPLSPASSVSSKLSESDNIRNVVRRRGRGRSRGGRRPSRRPRRALHEDERKDDSLSRPSDGETTEEDDDLASSSLNQTGTSGTFSESIPNSPLSHCSDTEDEKNWKNWKKSIMLVWKSAASHKYANVFMHPVTEDIAPGYSSIVFRPMNLGTIKKNVENGIIRTTAEFQRDVMLMFTNAIMYNSSNHNVYKMAVEMYHDVMQHIEQYVSTQLMVQSTDTKHLRTTRRVDNTSDKEEEAKRRRLSTDSHIHTEGGKAKKRKT